MKIVNTGLTPMWVPLAKFWFLGNEYISIYENQRIFLQYNLISYSVIFVETIAFLENFGLLFVSF